MFEQRVHTVDNASFKHNLRGLRKYRVLDKATITIGSFRLSNVALKTERGNSCIYQGRVSLGRDVLELRV